jgi:hypothetical protein
MGANSNYKERSMIDLMQDYVWSEADIKARLHAEIRSEISELMETEINRALQGAALGIHKLTPQEMQAIQKFKASTDRVAALGEKARADMALLNAALAYEADYRAWKDGAELTEPTAPAEVLELVEMRGRLLEPVAEPIEEAAP